MRPPGPIGHTSTDPQVLLGNQGDDGLHPDVLAYADSLGGVTPYRLRYLQRQYDRGIRFRVEAEDATPVITMLRRSGSVAVDRAVGERVTNNIHKKRRAA